MTTNHDDIIRRLCEASEGSAELLADLDFYDEDHWRNVMRQYPGAQDAIRKAAAAIRALEAKAATFLEQLVAAQHDILTIAADRDRLAGEVERLTFMLQERDAEIEDLKEYAKEEYSRGYDDGYEDHRANTRYH